MNKQIQDLDQHPAPVWERHMEPYDEVPNRDPIQYISEHRVTSFVAIATLASFTFSAMAFIGQAVLGH